jgi:hypothetical protein
MGLLGGTGIPLRSATAVHVQGHHHLLERRVARALADAVHGELHLSRPGRHGRQCVGRGEAQVVLAMKREHRARQLGHAHVQLFDQRLHPMGEDVADGVGNIDGPGPRGQRRANDVGDELQVGPRRVHRTELDVVGVAASPLHRRRSHGDHLVPVPPQLVGEVDVAAADEHVDARPRRLAQRLARRVHVGDNGPGEAADARLAHRPCHCGDGLPLAERGAREAGLDHVDAHGGEARGDLDLVARAKADARRLLAVAQGRIEDDDLLGHGSLLCRATSRSDVQV